MNVLNRSINLMEKCKPLPEQKTTGLLRCFVTWVEPLQGDHFINHLVNASLWLFVRLVQRMCVHV